MDIELLRERASLFRRVRQFFDDLGYLELDTPLLSPDLIPESCLEVFKTSYIRPTLHGCEPRKEDLFLIPSPEIWMKKIIAQHKSDVYQICKCFRNGESTGRQHSPEFSILEYYSMGKNYLDSLELTERLFTQLLPPEAPPELSPPFLRLDMDEAFRRFAGFPLYETVARGKESLAEAARGLGLDVPQTMALDDIYNLVFVHSVEPALPKDRPVVLMDYPAFVPCLAKNKDALRKERWELYVRGIELANCYTEETDSSEVRRCMEEESEVKAASSLVPHAVDPEYWKTFVSFPACSGVALGLDRLFMVLSGRSTIDSVLPFPMS